MDAFKKDNAEVPKPGFADGAEGTFVFCPKCEAKITEGAEDCDNCGSIFAVPQKADFSDTKKQWYYTYKSRYKGPYDASRIAELIRETTILKNTMIWRDGDRYAREAGESAFADLFLEDIKTPAEKLINQSWFLSFIALPIAFCTVLSAFLKDVLASYIILAVIYFVTSAWFLKKDLRELKSKGIELESWVWTGAIFAPVYMLHRIERTNKKYAYILVWAALVLLFFFR